MSISPASIVDASTYACAPYFLDDPAATTPPPEDDGSNANPPSAGLPGLQSGIAALERRFMAFTQMLRRELASLERKFSAALRSIVGSAKRADAPASTGAGALNAGGPIASAGPSAMMPYGEIIRRAAARNGVDPALVGAVVRRESGFRADAVSAAGAQGLMQLMPATAKQLGVDDPFDADENVEGGSRLLRTLLDRYDGRLDLALAAYNAGPAAVDRCGGVPPYPETRAYVQGIIADYRMAALRTS